MPRTSAPEKLTTRVGRWLLAVVIPVSVLGIGGLVTSVLVVTSLLAALACALLWIEPAARTAKAVRWALAGILLLVVWTAMQAVPLPAGLVGALAPANADVWARALLPFGEAGPRLHPLSIAPTATHLELLRALLYACVFLGSLRIAFVEGGSTFLERVLIVSACLVAFGTLGHPITQADRVFGIYLPRDGTEYVPGKIGPLLNPNHLSGYLNGGACVAAGTLIGRHRAVARPLAIGLVLLLAGTSVWAGSRGGMGTLALASLLIAGFAIQQRRHHAVYGRIEVGVGVVVFAAAAILIGIGSSESARSELAGRDVSKLDIIAAAFKLVPRSPFVGTGRGAFETVFPLVRMDTNYSTQIAPENIVAQWTIEYGVPVAIAAFALFALALRPRVVLAAARPAIGPWVAIVVVTLHDFVDFHLEVPGVVVFLVVCVAIVVSKRATSSEQEHSARSLKAPRWLAFAAATATLGATALVVPNVEHTLRDDRERLAKTVLDPNVTSEDFLRDVHGSLERFPAEPYFPLIAAVRVQQVDGRNPVSWIGRALEGYPRFGRAHLVMARALARTRRPQARLEYRLAFTYDKRLHGTIAHEAVFLAADPDTARQLVPEGPYGLVMLESLAAQLATRLPATALDLDTELLRRNPTAKGPLWRHVRATVSDLTNGHPWCADAQPCVDDGMESAEKLVKVEPQSCEARVLAARIRILGGDPTRGLDELDTSLDELPGCTMDLLQLAAAQNSPRHMNHAVERALRSDCGTAEACFRLFNRIAAFEESRRNPAGAIAFLKRAAEYEPEQDRTLTRIGELASKVGLYGEAIDAYSALERRHPENARYRALVDELRVRARAPAAATKRTP